MRSAFYSPLNEADGSAVDAALASFRGEAKKSERFENWPERLNALIALRCSRPFAWGEHDCALFACDAVLAMTGADPAAWFRGRYRTRRGAYRLLKTFGGAGLAATWEKIAAQRGLPEIAPAFARRGDVLLFDAIPLLPSGEASVFSAPSGKAGDLAGRRKLDLPEGANRMLASPEGNQKKGKRAEALGVCVGRDIAAAGPGGLVFLPLAAARRAWRV
jgi:hypothetical protein